MLQSKSRTLNSHGRRGLYDVTAAVLLIAAIAMVSFGVTQVLRRPGDAATSDAPPAGTAAVIRGPLSLVLNRKGTLECTTNTVMTSKVEWDTRLTYIAPEGTFVRQGDVVACLDVSKLKDEYGDEQSDVLRDEAALGMAQCNLEIQEIENKNAIERAVTNQDIAAIKLQAYEAAEYPQQVSLLEQQIAAADDALHTAEQKVRFTRRLVRKDFKPSTALQADLLALMKARQKHADLVEGLRVLRAHTHSRTIAELRGAAEQAAREVERQTALATTTILSRRIQVEILQRKLLRQREQFAWATRMLAHCEVRAPHDGQVVYPDQGDSWDEQISEGMLARFGQALAIIPDRSQMGVTVRVHESLHRRLVVGMPAILKISNDPDSSIAGRVSEVSAFPVTGRRQNRELREYEVQVQIEDPCEGLVPGLTANVDLIAASRDNALQVPIEAVTEIDDCYVAFVKSGESIEPRELTLGESTSDQVEILAGLSEGERVMLSPRDTCRDAVLAYEQLRSDHPLADGTLFAE